MFYFYNIALCFSFVPKYYNGDPRSDELKRITEIKVATNFVPDFQFGDKSFPAQTTTKPLNIVSYIYYDDSASQKVKKY